MRQRDDEFTRSPSNDPSPHSNYPSNPQNPGRSGAPSPPLGGEERVGEKEGGSGGSRPPQYPPNAFDREFLETFARREPAPATPEADNAGPWRVTRLHGAGEPRWGCIAAGEPPPLPCRFQLREPDVAFLTSAGLTLADRPVRFGFLRDAAGTLHLMQDGHSVGTVAASAPESEQLLVILTALHHLRVQPEALAHFLLAVPDGVLRRCGVVLAAMARGEGR